MRRGPLPPNALANPSQLLTTLARNAIANTVTTVTVNKDQSGMSNDVAALSSRQDDGNSLPTQLTSVPVLAKNTVNNDRPPPQTHAAIVAPIENTNKTTKRDVVAAADEDELKIVRKNLEALSKKDLNLLKSSHSRLYDFPTQVPTVLSSAYSNPQQNIHI